MSRTLSLDAARPTRQHLVGAATPVRVEGIPKRDHGREVLGTEKARHELHLLDPDAVLAGDATPQGDALVEDLMAGEEHAFHLFGISLVEEQDGVDVAVTGVE